MTEQDTQVVPEPQPEPQPEPEPQPVPQPEGELAAVRPADPGLEQRARGATQFKEDAVTVTPVPTLVKEEMTVGGRFYDLVADRIARRDEGMRYDIAVCQNCGHREELGAGYAPRTQYRACPVCGDTLRFTGVPIRDPNAAPLPAITEDELRMPVEEANA